MGVAVEVKTKGGIISPATGEGPPREGALALNVQEC
jgi:hypothetical protein